MCIFTYKYNIIHCIHEHYTARVKCLIMHGVNVQILSCPDVIFILHRDIHSITARFSCAHESVRNFSAISNYIIGLQHLAPLRLVRTPTTVFWRILRLKGHRNRRKPNRVAPARMCAYNKKDVILAYLNVLISQARISGCIKG